MSTENQARALMNRHAHLVKNRQQSLLNRAASEFGMEVGENSNNVQEKSKS